MNSKKVRFLVGGLKGKGSGKYVAYPFMAIPPFDEKIGNYVTGQHWTDDNPDGLTREEISREVEMSAAKRKKYPYVIYASTADKTNDISYPIRNGMELEIGVDDKGNPLSYKDMALYNFFKLLPEVAPNKESFRADSRHIFYIDDPEKEAEQKVSRKMKVYKAMSKVMENASIESWESIMSFLNYNVKGFYINYEKLSKKVLEERLLEACETHPDEILRVFDPAYADHLYILKLLRHGIISKRNEHFYDGELHIGSSIPDVLNYIKTEDGGSKLKAKWTRALNKAEGKQELTEV